MYLYDQIIQEINTYPIVVSSQLVFSKLSLEISQTCTNSCVHCANNSSPSAKNQLELSLLLNIIEQASTQKYSTIQLWGGEPFLYKGFFPLVELCLTQGLSIEIITNAFWAKSTDIVRSFVEHFSGFLSPNQTIQLDVSCDKFHQENVATPIQNVVNILSVLGDNRHPGFSCRTQSVIIPEDTCFEQALQLLKALHPTSNIELIKKQRKCFSLEFLGRARSLPKHKFPSSYRENRFVPIINGYNTLFNSGHTLYVSVSGDIVFCESWVGENFLSIGNIKNLSLLAAEQKFNSSVFFKVLNFLSPQYILYPFRKYLNLFDLGIEFFENEFSSPLIFRNMVVELFKIKKPKFDYSVKLQKARQVYNNKIISKTFLFDSLQVIAAYGDLSDVFALRSLLPVLPQNTAQEEIQDLLNSVYRL